jgi:hypothetical protein
LRSALKIEKYCPAFKTLGVISMKLKSIDHWYIPLLCISLKYTASLHTNSSGFTGQTADMIPAKLHKTDKK